MKKWNRKPRELTTEFIDELRTVFAYDPETGHLTWRVQRSNSVKGPIGAASKTPYIQVGYDYKIYLVHRVIFALMTGRWAYEVDHKNKNKRDNRWDNLREVVRSENLINIGLRSNNTSGHVGVSWHKGLSRWFAKVKVEGREITRSSKVKDVAIQMRRDLEVEYYGGYGS